VYYCLLFKKDFLKKSGNLVDCTGKISIDILATGNLTCKNCGGSNFRNSISIIQYQINYSNFKDQKLLTAAERESTAGSAAADRRAGTITECQHAVVVAPVGDPFIIICAICQ